MEGPLSWGDVAHRLVIVFLLIALNAFFVAAEFSVVSVRRSRMGHLAGKGDPQARTVQKLQRSLARLLSTTQVGITLSSLALGWIGESTIGVLVHQSLMALPLAEQHQRPLSQALSLPLAFLGVAYLQIVLGELCPKALAMLYPEQLARSLGPVSWTIARVFNPLIWLLNQSTRLFLSLFGIGYSGAFLAEQVTAEELQFIIESASESGLQAEERQLLSNVFEFSTVCAGEVMVPRPNLITLHQSATLADLLAAMADSGHSAYPVVADSLDEVLGVLDFRALAAPLQQNLLQLETSLTPWIRDAQFVSESMPLQELLALMQQADQDMAIVVDDYGGTAGLVTLMDLIEEVFDGAARRQALSDPRFKRIDSQTHQIQAQVYLEEVNDQLGLNLPLSEAYTTLGGFVINLLQHVPQPGDAGQYEGHEFTVISMEGQRLHLIQLRLPSADPVPSAEPTRDLAPGRGLGEWEHPHRDI